MSQIFIWERNLEERDDMSYYYNYYVGYKIDGKVYPYYNSKEYEAEMVRSVAYMLNDYSELPKDAILLALETEG